MRIPTSQIRNYTNAIHKWRQTSESELMVRYLIYVNVNLEIYRWAGQLAQDTHSSCPECAIPITNSIFMLTVGSEN